MAHHQLQTTNCSFGSELRCAAALVLATQVLLGACRQTDERTSRSLDVVKAEVFWPKTDPSGLLHVIGKRSKVFRKYGIDLRLKNRGLRGIGDALASDADVLFLFRGQLHMLETAQPGTLLSFGFNIQDAEHPNDALVLHPTATAITLSALRSQPIVPIVGGGPITAAVTKIALQQSGLLHPKLQFPYARPDSLSKASWLIAYAREPYLSGLIRKGRARILIKGPLLATHIVNPWVISTATMKRSFAQEKPKVAERLVQAYDETLAFVRLKPRQAHRHFGEFLQNAGGIDYPIGLLRPMGRHEISTELLQRQSDWLHDLGMSTPPPYAEHLRYNAPFQDNPFASPVETQRSQGIGSPQQSQRSEFNSDVDSSKELPKRSP